MSKGTKTLLIAVGVVATLGGLHLWQNVGLEKVGFGSKSGAQKFRVGFLPVT